MGILEQGLQRATIAMTIKSISLPRIDTTHIIHQKLGNNPVDVFADDNIYSECKIKGIDQLIIAGYGERNERGLGETRDIDYASYVTKIGVAAKDIPLIRTNGPFSNITMDLANFLFIWKKYYGSRTSHHALSINDTPSNPFTIISSGITLNDRYLHFDMIIANVKLVETNPGELKYFGDLILIASENIGYGSAYTRLDNYSENPEDRTTLSALTGSTYGLKLAEAVDQSFENLDFIRKELEAISPKLSIINHLLWVSNTFKHK